MRAHQLLTLALAAPFSTLPGHTTLLGLAVAPLATGLAPAQDDEPIPLEPPATPLDAAAWLDSTWAAFGAPEALEALGVVRMKGQVQALTSDFKGPFEELYHPDGRALQRIDFEGSDPVFFGVDGRLSWEAWSDEGVAKFDWHAAADYRRFFLHRHAGTPRAVAAEGDGAVPAPWRALYREVVVAGRAKVDGVTCVRLVLTPRAAREHGLAEVAPRRQPEPDVLWVDEATRLPVRLEMEMLRPAEGEIRLKESFGEWREFAGVRFPTRRKLEVPGAGLEFIVESVEAHVTAAESAFDIPVTLQNTVQENFPTAVRLPFNEWRVVEREAQQVVRLRTECAPQDEDLHLGTSRRALAAFLAEAGVAATGPYAVQDLVRGGELTTFVLVVPVERAPEIPSARAAELETLTVAAGRFVEGKHAGARSRLDETQLRLEYFLREQGLVKTGTLGEELALDPDTLGDPTAWRAIVRVPVR